jgi:HSP20 family protein
VSARWSTSVFDFLVDECLVEGACWRPSADVHRTQAGWVIKLDLAGVQPDDVSVELEGRRLIVRGCRRDTMISEGYEPYLMEISYSKFERSFDLPMITDLEELDVRATYRDGMLCIAVDTGKGDGRERA